MRKAVVAISALALLGAGAQESAAQGLSKEMLMGRWCTNGGSYFFEPDKLTVKTDAGGGSVRHIASIDIQGPLVIVNWREDGDVVTNGNRGKGSLTKFTNLANDHMTQLPIQFTDGSTAPVREFHRC